MYERIIDVSSTPLGLTTKLNQLVLKGEGVEQSIPLDEIAAIILSHPGVHMSLAAIAGICENGGAVLVCDRRHLPIGMMLPLATHSTQTERMAAQLGASVPCKKQLWRQIVYHKVIAQAQLLLHLNKDDCGLSHIARDVRSGDSTHIESRAARIYWQALLGSSFRRRPRSGDPLNSLLDYGYAVLRALVARALCSAGLHPSIGIHHHNRYDAFCLADDLMEPFRPLIDDSVMKLVEKRDGDLTLDTQAKQSLIGWTKCVRLSIEGERRGIFDILGRTAASVVQVFAGTRRKAALPMPDHSWFEDDQQD